MKRLIKFGSVGLVIAGAAIVGGEAFAQIPAISQYTVTNPTTSVQTRSVRIVGTPRTQIPVIIAGQPQTTSRQVRLNSCGQATIDSTDIQYIAFSQGANGEYPLGQMEVPATVSPIPTCVNGTSSLDNETAGAASPIINIGGGKVLINALKTPNNQGRVIDVQITKTTSRQRFVSTNACGIGQINLGETSSIPADATISVNNGTPSIINALPNGGSVPMVDCVDSTAVVNTGLTLGTAFKNASGDLFVRAASSSSSLSFVLPTGGVVNRSVTSDRCGGITLGSATNPQTAPFTLNGVSVDPSTLNTGLRPNCVLGTNGDYAYDVAPTGVFKLSDGRVFVATTSANPTGFGNRLIYTVSSTASATPRDYRADACGVVRVRQTTPAFTEIQQAGSSTFTLADLPTREYRCRNIRNVGSVPYATPAN